SFGSAAMSVRTTFATILPIGIGAALCMTGVLAQGTVPLAPGPHDALAAAGPQAAHIGQLWNLFLAICTAVFVAILVTLGSALARLPLEHAVNLQVTGHQWWWEIRYEGSPESQTFTTANELHVPVGRPVVIRLLADDVIHSLWVPNLSGKKDLIPGRTATVTF